MANNNIINAMASNVRATLAQVQATRKLLDEGHINYRAYEKTVNAFHKACNEYIMTATKQEV